MSLYLEAASILQSTQTTSLKAIVYNPSNPLKSPRSKLYALIVETLKFQGILKEVVDNAGILKVERKLTPLLSILLSHDLLLTKSGIATSSGPLKDAILRHKARLNAEFTRARLRRGHSDVKSLMAAVNEQHARESEDGVTTSSTGLTTFNPRWIRINTIKTSMDDILSSATFCGFSKVNSMADMFFFDLVRKHYYTKPELLQNIVAIHPSHDIISDELYQSGKIILQSASSCLPAIMLNPPQGSFVVDGCAAPGNKTTHLAALVGNTGRVFAVERDKRRAEILDVMTKKAGAENIVTILGSTDFTTIKQGHEAWQAEYLLLDPSCSGSGILKRVDWDISKLSLPSQGAGPSHSSETTRKRKRSKGNQEPVSKEESSEVPQVDEEEQDGDTTRERLQSLSDFQVAIILHAFSFPNAKRITYSTCSIYAEENEHVVARVLDSEIAKRRGWTVQSRKDNPLSTWHRRGLTQELVGLTSSPEERERIGEGCIRVNRTDSLGGGFFLVCFVRNGGDKERPSTNGESANFLDAERSHLIDVQSSSIDLEDEEWNGFSDTDTEKDQTPLASINDETDELSGKKKKRAKTPYESHAPVAKLSRRFKKGKKDL